MKPSASSSEGRVFLYSALAIGLAIRIVLFVNADALTPQIVDERQYTQLATNIVAGNGLAWGAGKPTSMRPPAYPAFLAATWSFAGVGNYQAVRLLQIAMALGTTWLLNLLGARVFGPAVGRYAAGTFWLYPTLMLFNFTLLSETLFTLLLVAFVLLSIMAVRSGSMVTALCTGVALGAAALTRSVLWPMPVVLCPLLAFLTPPPLGRRIGVPLMVFAGYLMVVGPWAVRNTTLQHAVTVVDTLGGLNLWMGNFENTPEDRMWDGVSLVGEGTWGPALLADHPNQYLSEGQKAQLAQQKAVQYMRAHPGQTLRRALIKFADFWGLEREFVAGVGNGLYRLPMWFAVGGTIAIALSYIVIALLGTAGIWLARPDIRSHLLLLLPVVAIIAAHTLTFGHSRYHLPLIPVLILYATALLTRRASLVQRRPRLALAAATATIAVLMLVWARQIFFVDAERLTRLFHG